MLFLKKFVLIVFILLCITSHCLAGYTSFFTILNFYTEYDDNIFFSYYYPDDDFLTIISPSFNGDYKSERFIWHSFVQLDFYRYLDNTNLNTTNQRYEAKSEYFITERWRFSVYGYFIKDTTLESELEETGIVHVRSDRQRYNISSKIEYSLNELNKLNFEVSYLKTDYDWKYYVDYNTLNYSLTYQRQMKNNKDTLMFRTYYSKTDSDTSNVNNYAILFGLQHAFSEILKFKSFLGLRYTIFQYFLYYETVVFDPSFWPPFRVVVYKEEKKDREITYLGSVSFSKKGERSTFSAGINKDLSFSSFGEPFDRTRIYGQFSFIINPRLRFLYYMGYYLNKSKGNVYKEDNIFYTIKPGISYKFNEHTTLRFNYSYAIYDDRVRDHKFGRNKIWFVINLKFDYL